MDWGVIEISMDVMASVPVLDGALIHVLSRQASVCGLPSVRPGCGPHSPGCLPAGSLHLSNTPGEAAKLFAQGASSPSHPKDHQYW